MLPLVVLGGLVALAGTVAAQDGDAAVSIEEPPDGATLASSAVLVKVDVEGAALADPALGRPGAHLRYTVDGRSARAPWPGGHRTDATEFTFTGLTPGPHVLAVELRRADESAFSPPRRAAVNVTVDDNVTFVAFREGRPTPGARTDGATVRAQLVLAGPGFDGIRWTLDGVEVVGAMAPALDVPRSAGSGPRLLRAELTSGGAPLEPPAFDEVGLDLPELSLVQPPEAVFAAAGFAPARVDLEAVLDGMDARRAGLRVTTAAGSKDVQGLAFDVALPLGPNRIEVRLLGPGGVPVEPAVVLVHDVLVRPPPPEVSFTTPRDLVTVLPSFVATVNVANFTLGGAGPVPASSGHLHWYLDGRRVEDSANTTHRFVDVPLGTHTIEVRLAREDHGEFGVETLRRVNVDALPAPAPEEAQGERRSPAPGAWVAALVAAGVAFCRRRAA